MTKIVLIMYFLFSFVTTAYCGVKPIIYIGVLSTDDKVICSHQWNPTAEYLTKSIPEYQFEIIPLCFEEIEETVASNQIDFLFVNPGIYSDLSTRYSLEQISTVKRLVSGESQVNFGGVIFTRSKNEKINSFSDLKGHSFAAVSEWSLGGWVAAWREFVNDGITPENDFSSISFLGTHEAVVHAVLSGEVDAGTVRTDTLERMAGEGLIDINNIHILSGSYLQKMLSNTPKTFPFILSTRLYPEWSISKLSHVSDQLAEKTAVFLINMPENFTELNNTQISGWTIPKNDLEIDRTFQELKIGIYSDLGNFSLWDSVVKYWYAFLFGGCFFLIMLISTIIIVTLNNRLKKSERNMRKMATHDHLTGLPNRSYFFEFSSKALSLAKRENKSIAILFIDLDRFKQVNDTYGHKRGDELLQSVATRLLTHLRNEDFVARIGGDEFAGLLYNPNSFDEITQAASRLIKDLSKPFMISGNELTIGCSIGVAVFPEHGNEIEELIERADQALYKVKKQGRGNVAIFENCMTVRS